MQIQYIAIFSTANIIYCNILRHQYNILVKIYCNIFFTNLFLRSLGYYPPWICEFIMCYNFSLSVQRLLLLTDVQKVQNASLSFRFQPDKITSDSIIKIKVL